MISVIVPVYNVENYLEKCLQSIINQTNGNWELLLVDDGSTDSSGEICDRYSKNYDRIAVFHKNNGGVSSARNVGLQHAKGDYVIFIDGDDWIEPTLFEDFCKINQEKKLDLFMFEYCIDDERESKIHFVDVKWYGDNDTEKALISTINPNNRLIGVKIYSKELIGGNRFDTGIILGEDTLFSVNVVSKAQSIYYSDKYYYHYVQSPNSAVRSSFKLEKLSGLEAYEKDIEICRLNGFLTALDYAKEAYIMLAIALAKEAYLDVSFDEKPVFTNIFSGIKKYSLDVLKSRHLSKKTKLKALCASVSLELTCKLLS